jgi:hypothetical protein
MRCFRWIDRPIPAAEVSIEKFRLEEIAMEGGGELFSTYDEVVSSGLAHEVLIKVIARNLKSKNYGQLVPLDGGTVGIANFATGGLASPYREMDTQKYFGKSAEEMISSYSSKCGPPDKRGTNDTGWGCFSQAWWHEGMSRFLASPESEKTQDRAWFNMMRPTINTALAHGWTDRRSLAIALGIANSVGGGGFEKLAAKHSWRAEEVLSAYAENNAHRQRRRDALNAAFPPTQ